LDEEIDQNSESHKLETLTVHITMAELINQKLFTVMTGNIKV